MKHTIKYIIVGILASLLSYILLSVFISNTTLVWTISLIIAILFLFIIRKIIQRYAFSFIFMVSVFFTVMLVPLFGKKETTSLEARTLPVFPKFDINYIWGFTYGVSDYMNNCFAYRNAAIAFLGKLKYNTFHESPMPNLVEIGKDSCLYYTPITYIHDISEPLTTEELENIRLKLDIMTRWFESKGIKYYFTSPPTKEHIYPEFMSPGMQYMTKFSRLSQLVEYLKDDTIIRFIDYRKELIENKKTRLTYEETDGHWNKFGAFFAYRKIMERMHQDFKEIRVAELSDYKMDSGIAVGGDLQRHLGFDDVFTMHFYNFTPKPDGHKYGAYPQAGDSAKLEKPSNDMLVQVRNMPPTIPNDSGNINACPLMLFVVRDSYTDAMQGFLSTQFKQTVYAFTKKPPIGLIMKVHPDIVLHEMLERYLGSEINLPDEIAGDSVFIKQNFPGYYKGKL